MAINWSTDLKNDVLIPFRVCRTTGVSSMFLRIMETHLHDQRIFRSIFNFKYHQNIVKPHMRTTRKRRTNHVDIVHDPVSKDRNLLVLGIRKGKSTK